MSYITLAAVIMRRRYIDVVLRCLSIKLSTKIVESPENRNIILFPVILLLHVFDVPEDTLQSTRLPPGVVLQSFS